MKHTNLTLYFLIILCASFALFKARSCYAFVAATPDATITANDYALLRGPLKVIAEANLNPESSKPLYFTPPGVSSSLPMAGLVSGAGAIAGLAYYQRTGVDPVYAAANAIASAADQIFVPAYQAFRQNFVSPESFPASVPQFIGVDASIGISVGDLLMHVKNSGSYPALKALSDSFSSPSGYVSPATGPTIIPYPGGGQVKFIQAWRFFSSSWYLPNGPPSNAFYLDGYLSWFNTENSMLRLAYTGPWHGDQWPAVHARNGEGWTSEAPLPLVPGAVDYASLKSSLQTPSPTVASEIKDAVNTAPVEQTGVSSSPSPSASPAQVQPAINGQQLQNFYTQNATSVANYNTTNITNNSTIQDIAKGQAATTAAQQQAQQAQNDYPKTITFSGSASLPDANQYDPTLENPEEQNFVNKVHSFLNSGLPVLSAIRSSGLSASGSPRMNTTIWGYPVVIDFSDQQTPIRAAGSVLVIISLILAYLIVVRS